MASRDLPYFKWYPADCDTDERVRSMDDREFGFYMRCLNHSWKNDGLPGNLPDLARAMTRTPAYVERMWKRVGACFVLREGRLVNQRQEDQRALARIKSAHNARSVRSRYERSTNEPQRAYDSESDCKDSDSKNSDKQKEPEEPEKEKLLAGLRALWASAGLPFNYTDETQGGTLFLVRPIDKCRNITAFAIWAFSSRYWPSPQKTKRFYKFIEEGTGENGAPVRTLQVVSEASQRDAGVADLLDRWRPEGRSRK